MRIFDPQLRVAAARASNAIQGSAAWLESRTGVVTCSRLNDVLATLKNGQSSQKYLDYLQEKIVERVTGDIADHYVTSAMQRGIDLEPIARELYEARTAVKVHETGLIPHPHIQYFAGSPDGLVGADGMIEIKTCAAREKYLAIVMSRDYAEYECQVQGLLACTGRQWCDLIVYDDRFHPDQALHVVRLFRDEGKIERIEENVILFLAALDDMTEQAQLALGGATT